MVEGKNERGFLKFACTMSDALNKQWSGCRGRVMYWIWIGAVMG